MWYYVVLVIGVGFLTESSHDIFDTKEYCEKVAINFARQEHRIYPENNYGYICKFDPSAKLYMPQKLEE